MNDNWETYTINFGTPDEEDPRDYARVENIRAELTDKFKSELYALIEKYQGACLLHITAVSSEGQPIVRYF